MSFEVVKKLIPFIMEDGGVDGTVIDRQKFLNTYVYFFLSIFAYKIISSDKKPLLQNAQI